MPPRSGYLSQVGIVVDISNSRVGKVDEGVSAGLLQQRDALQVDLHALQHFGQVLVVLFQAQAQIISLLSQRLVSRRNRCSPRFCSRRSWCWTWSPAAERDTDRCSRNSPCHKNLVINQTTSFPKTPVQKVSSCVTCTCFPESGRCLDSGTAFQEGSSSWRDGRGMACLWSTNTHVRIHEHRVRVVISGELRCNFTFSTLNSCRLASGSHNSFSTLPPTTNRVVTMPISTQEKMKEKPTPLKETPTDTSLSCEVNRSVTPCCSHGNIRHQQVAPGVWQATSGCRRGLLVVTAGAAQQSEHVEGQDEDDHAEHPHTTDPPAHTHTHTFIQPWQCQRD